ncbi:thiol-disulfide oxidoreductase ResA [Thermoflavimicrobium daqui]|uniref:Thiol-disulfide oxidoreductase n=1 Tax=Thermoflavimicrobium daqui TaxID=2137476 RepID=A0A364K6Q7_9BACL|nr:thiol-disulfide oxidoreductase ResA [Thermoflavimicrobium daqui]RAL25991.1 thiol-disulfide oxidoreductase [Thermoflavimicrobium daqui]
MKKETRLWIRRVIFLVLLAALGYSLYLVINPSTAQKPQVGQVAPDFQLKTLDGKEIKLSQLRGKAVMLNFWGTWCEPCRSEMPAMQSMYSKYKNKGFEILAINIAETDIAVSNFKEQYQLGFPILMDKSRDVVRLYKIKPLPSSVFIDPQGKVKNFIEGPLDTSQLELYINQILPR